MSTILTLLEFASPIAIWLIFLWLKKLPETIHQRNIKAFEAGLNKELESFKYSLTKEIELLKINESQLYIHKSEEFLNLVEILMKNLLDKDYIEKIQTDADTKKAFTSKTMRLGTNLFLFASDDTIKKFVEWKTTGQNASSSNDSMNLVILLAELIISIRKDLGYKDTICTIDDYLHIILNDWDDYKDKKQG